MAVPDTIVCVECGSTAHLLGREPELGWAEGDLVVYRCSGCADRFDLMVTITDLDPES